MVAVVARAIQQSRQGHSLNRASMFPAVHAVLRVEHPSLLRSLRKDLPRVIVGEQMLKRASMSP
jgi:hypothetical protein